MRMSGMAYICSAGDTFDMIALRIYGDEKRAAVLLEANPLLASVMEFSGGEEVLLPVVETTESDGGKAYVSATAPWREA